MALFLHAALPRYDWLQNGRYYVRIDRWTGRAEIGDFSDSRGWMSEAEQEAETASRMRPAPTPAEFDLSGIEDLLVSPPERTK